ncbi:unnamed protein product [Caenorhabditis auriculariae]|uniref:C2 domain-containing protein n=1 Tax=Caenorhabditis auriculariae TaxID=2777116 RepID=A0A8S1GQZ7_9PELO|nr:unnamed protein product [Caenorhabditis auriculariae]
MREAKVVSLAAAVLLEHSDDVTRRNGLLQRLGEVLDLTSPRLSTVLDKAETFQKFYLHICSTLNTTNENLLLHIFDDSSCRQHTLNSGENYQIELGSTAAFKVKFSLTRFNGEKRRAMVRSTSFLKRVMSLDKRQNEGIPLDAIPLGSLLKKAISLKGKTHSVEMKVVREDKRDEVEKIDFDDFHEFTRLLHEWTAEQSQSSQYDGELDEISEKLLIAISSFFGIPFIVSDVAEMSTFLVWDSEKKALQPSAISRVSSKMASRNFMDSDEKHSYMVSEPFRGMKIKEPSLSCLSACLNDAIDEILAEFAGESLFPPHGHDLLKRLNSALRGIVEVCVLPMWDSFPEMDPSLGISRKLEEMLRKSTIGWTREHLRVDDNEFPIHLYTMHQQLSTEFHPFQLFYRQFNANYLKIVFEEFDKPLADVTQAYLKAELTTLDSRDEQILESFAKRTMKLFDVLRSFSTFAVASGVSEDVNDDKLLLHSFENWFLEVTVFWTYSWRQITSKMVERTISLDDDGEATKYDQRRPLPAGLYSFLCIQKGLSDDYNRLSFANAQNLLMGAVALVHIMCENNFAYAKKLFSEAVSVSDEIVTAEEAEHLENTARHVLVASRTRCEELMSHLIQRLFKARHEEIHKICKSLTLDSHEYSRTLSSYMREVTPIERMNAILASADAFVDVIRCEFLPNCFRQATKVLGTYFEEEIRRLLRDAQPPDYYSNVYVTVKFLYDLLGIESSSVNLLSALHQKSFSTLELLLAYYASLCDKVEQTTGDDFPTVDVQLSFVKATSDQVLILINVLKLSPLQWLDPLSDRVDIFVKLELLPKALFPDKHFAIQTTKPVPQSTKPAWRQHFEMLVPTQSFYTHGATFGITVMDHDRLCDRILGRTFVPLHKIPVSCPSLPTPNLVPIRRLPLLSHLGNTNSAYYQLLKERARVDSTARGFISREGKHAQLRMLPAIIHRRITSAP